MEQFIIKLAKKISLKLNLIFIILICSIIFYYVSNQKNFIELQKFEQVILLCNQLKDNIENIKQKNNLPEVVSDVKNNQPIIDYNSKNAHSLVTAFTNIQNIKDSVYSGEEYSRYVSQLENIADENNKIYIDEILSCNNNFLPISELIKIVEKINFINESVKENSKPYDILSYISNIIKIKKPLPVINNDIIVDIKNYIIDRKFDLALKNIEILETKNYDVSYLKEKVKLVISVELAFRNLNLYLSSDDYVKSRL